MKTVRWIKVMALLLAMLMLLPMVLACKKEEESVSETEETTEETVILPITLIENGKSDYVIVRSSTASQAEISAATLLRDTIYERCGIRLKLLNELDVKNEKAICVGRVSRDSVTSLAVDVEYTDYVIGVSDTDLVICGGCGEKTTEAVERFISEYLSEKTKTLTVAGDLKILSIDPNKKTVMVGDLKLINYSVVTPISEIPILTHKVTEFNAYCYETFGYKLESKTDAKLPAGKEIIVGDTVRPKSAALQAEISSCGTNYGTIYFDDGNIWITGNTAYAAVAAFEVFVRDYIEAAEMVDDAYQLSTANKRVDCTGPEYTLMSFNILYDDGNGGGMWKSPAERKDAVLYQINSTNPDMLGVQECTLWWYETLNAALLDRYAVVGEINDPGGQNWRNAIYYRKDKFDLLETKTKWLTDTPDVKSRLDSGGQYRIVTYAVLRDKVTGETFAYCNTHMGFGSINRPRQDEILVNIAKSLGLPVLISGDFNDGDFVHTEFGRSSSALKAFMKRDGLWDARNMTNIANRKSTIDYCFVSEDSISVHTTQFLDQKVNGIDPSDHDAVVITFKLKKS